MAPPNKLQTLDAGEKVTDVDALAVVTQNYETCNATRDRLIELQNWVKEQNEVGE